MILRVIRGRADRAKVAALRDALIDRLGPGPEGREGPDRYHIGIRPSGDELEVLLLACWRSAEAATEGDARQISPMRLAARHIDRVEVGHFEIDMNLLRDAEAQPIALRVAIGRFNRPGGDIQMQEVLRERLASIGPELTEAYVGRRLLGRTVEVAFVSAWRDVLSSQPLDAPFWPDTSIRYDEFSVEVYRPVD